MKKSVIGLSLIALAFAGTAIANEHAGHGKGMDPFGDKTVTRAEAQAHAAAMFAKLDANGDGKLDMADRAAHHAAMFDRLDTNKDGSVSRAEFDAAHQGGMAGEDGQGMGMGMGGKRMGGHGGKMGMMMLHMADADKDHAVTREEFLAAHQKHFDKADTDKDGKLTPAERKAAHARMRGHMMQMRGAGGGHGEHGGAMPPPPPAD